MKQQSHYTPLIFLLFFLLQKSNIMATPVHISPLTNAILNRYYLIARLTNTIALFNHINKKIESHGHCINVDQLCDFDPSMSFKHQYIQQSIDLIKKNKNLTSLFMVWHDFVSYKSLDDELFIEDFTKEIFVLSKNVFLHAHSNRTIPLVSSDYAKNLTVEQLLDAIDLFTDSVVQPGKNPFKYKKNRDQTECAHVDDVMSCFYYIKRLSDTHKLLSYLHKKNYYHKQTGDIHKNSHPFIYDTAHFSHEKIIASIQTIIATHSLESLLLLLQEVKQYRYIQDTDFMRELLMLIGITHKQIIINIAHKNNMPLKKSTLDTIISISQKIDRLPITELLNAIDMLVEELPVFLEKYEFNSDITWKVWLKKYWWIPPMIIAWFGLKFFVKLQHRPGYFSSMAYYQNSPHHELLVEIPQDEEFII